MKACTHPEATKTTNSNENLITTISPSGRKIFSSHTPRTWAFYCRSHDPFFNIRVKILFYTSYFVH